MATIKLGNLSQSSSSTRGYFLVGDVIESGKGSDPVIVSNLTDLYRKYRYSKRYYQYKKLLESGASVCLAGCGNITAFPTLALFYKEGNINSNPYLEQEITQAYPTTDALYSLESELLGELRKSVLRNPLSYSGSVQAINDFSYQQILEIDENASLWELFRDLVNLQDLEDPESVPEPESTFSIKSLYAPIPYSPGQAYSNLIDSIKFARFGIYNDNLSVTDLIANWYVIFNEIYVSNDRYGGDPSQRVYPSDKDKYFNVLTQEFEKRGFKFDYSKGKQQFIDTYFSLYKELVLQIYGSLGIATDEESTIYTNSTLTIRSGESVTIDLPESNNTGRLYVSLNSNSDNLKVTYRGSQFTDIRKNGYTHTYEIDTSVGSDSSLVIENLSNSTLSLTDINIVFKEYIVAFKQEGNKLILDFKYPTYVPDWNSGRFKYLTVRSNMSLTQDIYYYRGLINQGLFASFVSKISGREGTDTYVKVKTDNLTLSNFETYITTISVKFLNEESTYIGTFTYEDFVGVYMTADDLVSLVDVRPPRSELSRPPATKYYGLRYAEEPPFTINGLIEGYRAFEEYDTYVDAILAPENYWTNYLGNSELRRAILDNTKTLNEGGCNSTILFSADDCYDQLGPASTNQRLIALKSEFNNPKCFFFSGGYEIPSRILYLIKWITKNSFVPESLGKLNLFRIPETMYVDYNRHELVFDDNPDLQVELSLSNLATCIKSVLIPGNSKQLIYLDINHMISVIQSNNPIIDSITLRDIYQEQNTLIVNLITSYRRLDEIIYINFNITNKS